MDRSKSKSRLILNISLGFINKFIIVLLGFFLRKIFIQYLGAEMSGLSSLFTNIIEFLNLATAGFMTAVTPRLYDYNESDDFENMNRTMALTRRFYFMVTGIILVTGFICSFFIQNMIAGNSYSLSFLRFVFMIQVMAQCVRAMINPWQGILGVREQGYVSTVYELWINILIYVGQGITIILFSDYIFYVLINLVGQIVLYGLLRYKVRKIYPWLEKKVKNGIERIIDLLRDIRYTILMQIANFIFMSTDSAVISTFLGLLATNAYGNYMTIATSVIAIYTVFEGSIKVFFGNKLRRYSPVMEKEHFLNISTYLFYIVGSVCAVLFATLIEDFIALWLGSTFIQGRQIAILFATYLFLQLLFCGVQDYLQNFGLFKDELRANMPAAIVNIVLSVLLVQKMGISGALFGTIAGIIIRFLLRERGCFEDMKRSGVSYLVKVVFYIVAFYGILFLNIGLSEKIIVDNILLRIFVKLVASGFLTTCISMLIFCWSSEQKETWKLTYELWKKIFNKLNGKTRHEF